MWVPALLLEHLIHIQTFDQSLRLLRSQQLANLLPETSLKMMISNIPITAIAMISLLLPGVIAESGPDGGLGTQSLDIKLKWHATGSCNGQGGPERDYSNGACLDIPGTTRGVEILDRKAGCYSKYLSYPGDEARTVSIVGK